MKQGALWERYLERERNHDKISWHNHTTWMLPDLTNFQAPKLNTSRQRYIIFMMRNLYDYEGYESLWTPLKKRC